MNSWNPYRQWYIASMAAIAQKLRHWLWDDAPAPLPVRSLRAATRFAYGLTRDITAGDISLHAMALVYTTLLATVPFIAFSFAVLRGLNVHIELQPVLQEFLLPLGEQGVAISARIIEMVNNVSGGVLGGISLVLFLYTALSMVQKVESSFNVMWHVRRPRNLGRRLVDYAAIVLLTPAVLSAAMASIATLSSTALIQSATSLPVLSVLLTSVGRLTPFLLVTVLFTGLYLALPNTRVRLPAALFGAVLAGITWAAAGAWFTDFVVYSARTRAIYAGFAIAISALLWLYVNWLILLLGARLAFYFQHREYLRIGRSTIRLSSRTRERLALNIVVEAAAALYQRSPGPTVDELATDAGVPSAVLDTVADTLQAVDLIQRTEQGTLLPAIDIHAITLGEVLERIRTIGDEGLAQSPEVTPTVDAAAKRLEAAWVSEAEKIPLVALLQVEGQTS
ncbi:MAG: YihY/virulence factor BrkB family protein [Pseudomonadota bacterium]